MNKISHHTYFILSLMALSISACGGAKENTSSNNQMMVDPSPFTLAVDVTNPVATDPVDEYSLAIVEQVIPFLASPTPDTPDPTNPETLDSERVLEKFVGVWDASDNGDEHYVVVQSPEERDGDASVYEFNYRGDQYEAEHGTYQNCYSAYPAGDMKQNEDGAVELQGLEVSIADNFLVAEPWGRLRRTQLVASDLSPTCTDEQELAYSVDVDGDGLPNTLELEIGLSQFQSDSDENGVPDGDEDHDSDGVTNLQEYLDGTLPECIKDGSRFDWDRNCEVSVQNSNAANRTGYIRAIEGILWCNGYANGAKTDKFIDGIYGSVTARAVSRYQSDNFLPSTGVVDGNTWSSLMQKISQDSAAQNSYKACDQVVFEYVNQAWRIKIFYDNFGLFIPIQMTFR